MPPQSFSGYATRMSASGGVVDHSRTSSARRSAVLPATLLPAARSKKIKEA